MSFQTAIAAVSQREAENGFAPFPELDRKLCNWEEPDERDLPEEINYDSDDDTATQFALLNPILAKYRRETAFGDADLAGLEPSQRSFKYKTVKQMPAAFKFKETDPAYNVLPWELTEDYRGQDLKYFDHFAAGKKSSKHYAFLSLSLPDSGGRMNNIFWGANYGSEPQDGVKIRVEAMLDTAFPSLAIYVHRHDKTVVECRVFASACEYFECYPPRQITEKWLPIVECPQFDQMRNNELFQYRFKLKDDSKMVFSGMNRARLDELDATPGWFDDHVADVIISDLFKVREMAATITVPKNVASANDFADHFELLMRTVIQHGNFPFQALQQKGVDMATRNFTFEGADAAPPRHLVKKWLVVADPEGTRIERLLPLEWANYRDPGIWPDEETANTAYRLGLGRKRPLTTQILSDSLIKQSVEARRSKTEGFAQHNGLKMMRDLLDLLCPAAPRECRIMAASVYKGWLDLNVRPDPKFTFIDTLNVVDLSAGPSTGSKRGRRKFGGRRWPQNR
ncbi:hypothetical protein AUEXF2481DRAFT_280 [Aureobasidium subglaciale EXF-2481]|uniref:Uncharacterized protein n=1 Tax=Aureobasidium subglaciale (strain EXF-2481) TaxID=1043005 RepID=A0A074Z1X2_AURSE|nr:uncharacterized protein AUEXF2481DRAFT_280 [Aureobasidium subglaciale EXF-2481]KAI5212234.1 hypothetical protein E4T38_00649 [Aureobasidium subglaciale]KAI5231297.1 hypothetical protein E4T40_00650 [Aureobasidium subglaciale]KAI5234080.1 hypothetical protein E4T41_00648 [Aureobasidium subglaciale]KAI5267661.1 hypothetical protein E4T46_00648 [Aureobasidium subglaciale]KER00333.1 hypothetical protein AUEXF2481DRAFT_280 [Aureobasidium subglaciale EXF-2481]